MRLKFANDGICFGQTIRGQPHDLAIVFERPPIVSEALLDWFAEANILPRLNSVHVIYPELSDKPKLSLPALRKGWQRVQFELQHQQVKRALVMGSDSIIGLIAPGLRGSVDEKDVGLRQAHGTLFKRDGIEYVPTWLNYQKWHMQAWWERDIDRFLNLKRPDAPLEYDINITDASKVPDWFVVDLETTGLDTYSDKVTTLGFQYGDNKRCLIQDDAEKIAFYIEILTDCAKHGSQFIFHNGQFDLGFMGDAFREAAYGKIHDTMIHSKSNGELMNSLKHLGIMYTDRPGNYAWHDGARSFDDPAYVCEDLEVTWQLAKRHFGIMQ